MALWHLNKGVTMTTIKTERITARVSESIKDTLGVAAKNIIEKDKVISLSSKDAKLFFDILDSPPEPNKKLKNAFDNYKSMIG